ncbi:hypothetical protein [Acinetobacter ihumii]|uniref:hypothetical protein n=1 Tax=Acinetobacter ihumii TaxID=2483802 RepID=UPI001030547B|nr:hypothetical protein [Acinetobacter ihumii]
MLIAKLLIVPFFILLVSLAGRRWGNKVAGILSGMPVVAGPIVVLMACEQGVEFGLHAATAGISGVVSLLSFGITYCWLSRSCHWSLSFLGGILVWMVTSVLLTFVPQNLYVVSVVAILGLILTPLILPKLSTISLPTRQFNDLALRMLTGGIFTLTVTTLAYVLNSQWSGLLAVFPIIGSVMAIFTHIMQGSEAVAMLYHGTVRGLYSLTTFFIALATGWNSFDFWSVVVVGVLMAIMVQLVFYFISRISVAIKI